MTALRQQAQARLQGLEGGLADMQRQLTKLQQDLVWQGGAIQECKFWLAAIEISLTGQEAQPSVTDKL